MIKKMSLEIFAGGGGTSSVSWSTKARTKRTLPRRYSGTRTRCWST